MPDQNRQPHPDALTEEQQGRMKRRGADQDRTLLAMQQLEAALGTAAPLREQAWRTEVCRTLAVLGEAAKEEADNAAQPDSLLSDIARTQPWLRNRVRGLRVHYRQLRDNFTALQHELDHPADPAVDFTDIRQRLAWVLAGLRHQRARESDLIYEAYCDAVRADIEEDNPHHPAGHGDRHLRGTPRLARQERARPGAERARGRSVGGGHGPHAIRTSPAEPASGWLNRAAPAHVKPLGEICRSRGGVP